VGRPAACGAACLGELPSRRVDSRPALADQAVASATSAAWVSIVRSYQVTSSEAVQQRNGPLDRHAVAAGAEPCVLRRAIWIRMPGRLTRVNGVVALPWSATVSAGAARLAATAADRRAPVKA